MRVGIDVVQPHPGAEGLGQRAKLLAQRQHLRLHRLSVPEAGAELDIDAVGAGVLADHQQFLHTRLEQTPRLAQHIAHRARDQVASHAGNDAKAAAVIAALADLQVGIVARRELDADLVEIRRHEIDEGVVRLGQMRMHRVHHFLRGMRPRHGQHLRMHLPHQVATAFARPRAQAAGDDDLAVAGQRLADGVQAFLHRGVDETAGVDDHQIGAVVGLARDVAFSLQLGQDQFGIGQRLGAAEADESDGRCGDRRGRTRRGNIGGLHARDCPASARGGRSVSASVQAAP